MKAEVSLAREIAVPEPDVAYRNADYSVSIDVRDGNVSLSINVRPYRVLSGGTRELSPDVLHRSISWASYSRQEASRGQDALVEAVARAVEAISAEEG